MSKLESFPSFTYVGDKVDTCIEYMPFCTDNVLHAILASSLTSQDFETCNGIEEVAHLLRDKQLDENLRYPFSPCSSSANS